MPLQATSGAASYDAFGGGVAVEPKYIEDYFSTYLVTGDGTAPAVNNGIDLSTKGGLVWIKRRSAAGSHNLFDTARGANLRLISNDTAAQDSKNLSFTTTGFSNFTFDSGVTEVSWSWAKAPKFFDVVTYTGNSSTRTISHSLASAPGMIIIKRTTDASDWWSWHRTFSANEYVMLNSTAAKASGANSFISSDSTGFTIGSESNINGSGNSYVAYLFAHNAGGFGLTGTDNVISCGSFTTNGSGVASVTLDYEPQFLLVKRTDSTSDWFMMDNMRGLTADPNNPVAMLRANLSNAENTASYVGWSINATGFGWSAGLASGTYIYIAIRRGPMKVPTSGTSVFAPAFRTTTTPNFVTGFPVDLYTYAYRPSPEIRFNSRLTNDFCVTSSTAAATDLGASGTPGGTFGADSNTGWGFGQTANTNVIAWNFRRAPSTFDEVCYTGNATAPMNVPHNLGVTPQLMIIKKRNGAEDWNVFNTVISDAYGGTGRLFLNKTDAYASTGWVAPIATSTAITLDTSYFLNQSGNTYVAYLWATNPGVTKVGTYTGTGSTQTINCGFTGGSRLVLIKRTDSTGDWVLWDSARGMVSGTDPRLALNSTSAEVNANWVYATTGGFQIVTSDATVNASGGSYIFLSYA